MSFDHLAHVLDEVKELGERFNAAGRRLFLVGGIVRDQWLGRPLDSSSDIDLTTDALPAEIKLIVAPVADDLWSQGEKFGTIGLRIGGRDIEITTHRAESYSSESRKPIVSFGDDIHVDLSRRDFTVNAMAIEVPDGELVDPFGGTDDLAAAVLRTPLSPDVSFTDDPLRMLRAARFSAKYELVPSADLRASAAALCDRTRIVAIERIAVEMRRLLALERSPEGLAFLVDTGVLAEVLSYGEPERIPDISSRLLEAVEVVADLRRDWATALAGIGLVVFGDAAGVHEMCIRLRLSRDERRLITAKAKMALAVDGVADLSPATLRRWVDVHGVDEDAIRLGYRLGREKAAEADKPANQAGTVGAPALEAFLAALDELTNETTESQLLDGATIMHVLDIGPGPAVGEATAFLHERYLADGPMTDDTQIAALQDWWASRDSN